MTSLKQFIKTYLWFIYRPILNRYREKKKYNFIKKDILRLQSIKESLNNNQPYIYYLGITAHSNLGDMGQYYCISKWIKENYPNYSLIEFEADTVVDHRFGFIDKFKELYRAQDIIIFQSGYTTQDLGGSHEYMHRLVIDNIPNANILMMPQTIYFKEEKNKIRTSKSYNQARHMLFLARDFISYEMARNMFPDITVEAYPDIVTTLIGEYNFSYKRKGICFCLRNDGEKLYSTNELIDLQSKIEKISPVTVTDTTINKSYKKIRKHLQYHIEKQIEEFAHYEIVITDRYHGTIYALAANTPVIILKTNDHKVITGADWFKGIYDKYVYTTNSLNEVVETAKRIINEHFDYKLSPYFKQQYYDKLKGEFQLQLNR